MKDQFTPNHVILLSILYGAQETIEALDGKVPKDIFEAHKMMFRQFSDNTNRAEAIKDIGDFMFQLQELMTILDNWEQQQ